MLTVNITYLKGLFMTEIGDRLDTRFQGTCILLDIMEMTTPFGKPKRDLFGKPKWHIFVFLEKLNCCDTIESNQCRTFQMPLEKKSLDQLGDTLEEAQFRIWAMELLQLRYRSGTSPYESALADAIAKLAQFDPKAASQINPLRGLDQSLKSLEQVFFRREMSGEEYHQRKREVFMEFQEASWTTEQ